MISTITSDLLEQIKASYVTEALLQSLIAKLAADPLADASYVLQNGVLYRRGKIVVGPDKNLRQEILQFQHESAMGGHSEMTTTLQRVSKICYWKELRKDIYAYSRACETCQKCKGETVASPGLLQPLLIPDKVWQDISLDFIEGLPKAQSKSAILVVVDRLSKYAHFISLTHPYTSITISQALMDNIYKLHGLPQTIVSDKNVIFSQQSLADSFQYTRS